MKLSGWIFLMFITLSAVVGNGCASKIFVSNAVETTINMNDLEKLSGLKPPASAKILAQVSEGGHDGTKFKKWIVVASERFTLAGTTFDGDDNQTFVQTIREMMPDRDIGKPLSKQYQFSDWRNENGQWQAATVETDQGFYLSLENIILD